MSHADDILVSDFMGTQMSTITEEIKAFEKMQSQLEADHMGLWVLIHDGALIDAYQSFEDAADEAVRRFGSGPFLIRQVGAAPKTLPISLMYHRSH